MSKGGLERIMQTPTHAHVDDDGVEMPSLMGARVRRAARQLVQAIVLAPMVVAHALVDYFTRALQSKERHGPPMRMMRR
jgi:hypothetical protein